MKICIYGAGATGGHLAARLSTAGHAVSVVCRGAHLAAIRANGITLRVGEQIVHADVDASESAAALGPQDFVIVTLKQGALAAFAIDVDPLLSPRTAVVFAQNGIPWWYGIGLAAGRPAPPDLSALDAGGALARAVSADRILGAVIYSSNEVIEPGVIMNDSPTRNALIVGELDDSSTPRVAVLREALNTAGIDSPDCTDIRATLWRKLLINIAGAAVCSIIEQATGASREDPDIAALYRRLSAEVTAVALAHGIRIEDGEMPQGPPAAGHKPSLLQDYEKRRPMEIESILKAPLAFARVAGIDAIALEVVVALAANRAANRGLYEPAKQPHR